MLPRLNLIAIVGAVAFHQVVASTSIPCISEIHVEVATLFVEYPVVISASVAHPTTWTVNDQITLTIPSATDLCLTTASTKTVVETKTLSVSSIDSASNGIATVATSPATSSSWEYSHYVPIATSYGIDPSQTSKTGTQTPLSSGVEIASSIITASTAGLSAHTTRPDQGHITPTGPALAASAPASSAEDSMWNGASIVSPLSGTGMSTSSDGLVPNTSTSIAAPLRNSSTVSGSFQAFGATGRSSSTSSPSPTPSTMTTITVNDSHTSSTLLFQNSTDLSGISVTSNDTRPSTRVPAVTSTVTWSGTSLSGINMTVPGRPVFTDPQAGPSSADLPSSTRTTSLDNNVTRSYTTRTSFLDPGQSRYTSTIVSPGGRTVSVIVGVPETIDSTIVYLDPSATPYTSSIAPNGTIPGTVIYGVPETIVTTTTYLSPNTTGYTSTFQPVGSTPGTVVLGVPESITTSTSFLAPNLTGYTTTIQPSESIPGTVIIGYPETIATSTAFLPPNETGYTSSFSPLGPTPGTVLIGYPETVETSTTFLLPNETGYTSTISPVGTTAGTIVVGYVETIVTSTTFIAPNDTRYTSTVPPVDTTPGTVIIGYPETILTTTIFLVPGETGYTSTVDPAGSVPGTVVVGLPEVITTTTTSFLTAGASAYTTTVTPSGTTPGTVIYGIPQSTITTTITGATAGTSITPATDTIPGTVIVTYVSRTPTTTTVISGTAGFTTTLAASGSGPATVIVDVPSPTAGFTCDPRGYLIQTVNNNAALYSVNITTGVVTTITSAVSGGSGGINAIGFNVFDNNLYGTNSTGAVLRITTAGKTEFVTQLPQHSYFNSADVDTNGQYWVSEDGKQWYQIDLLPGSPTYGQIVDYGVSTVPSGLRLIDWVYLPGQGNYLWATAYNTGTSSLNSLLKWSMTTHTWTVVTDYTELTGEFGAVYGASNGTFWGSRNSDGYIYRFDTAGDAPVLTSSGPVSNLNDGARCVLAALN